MNLLEKDNLSQKNMPSTTVFSDKTDNDMVMVFVR